MSYQLDSIFNRLKERNEKKDKINESDLKFLKKFESRPQNYQYPQPIEEIYSRLKFSAIKNGQFVNEEKLLQQAWRIRDRQIFEVNNNNNSSFSPSAAATAASSSSAGAGGAGGAGGGGSGNRRRIGNHYIDDDYIDDGYYE